MSTEVTVGVIALLGAVVGATAAFAGVVYQQRQQARLLRVERRDAQAHQAVDVLIAELEKVRHLAWSGEEDNPQGFIRAIGQHTDVIRLAALRLPDKDLREAIEAACMLGFGHSASFRAHVGLDVQQVVMVAMATDAQKCLGAYLRQDARPETTFLFQARDYYESMLTLPRRT